MLFSLQRIFMNGKFWNMFPDSKQFRPRTGPHLARVKSMRVWVLALWKICSACVLWMSQQNSIKVIETLSHEKNSLFANLNDLICAIFKIHKIRQIVKYLQTVIRVSWAFTWLIVWLLEAFPNKRPPFKKLLSIDAKLHVNTVQL